MYPYRIIAFHSNRVKFNPICGSQDSSCGRTNRSVQVKRYIWQVSLFLKIAINEVLGVITCIDLLAYRPHWPGDRTLATRVCHGFGDIIGGVGVGGASGVPAAVAIVVSVAVVRFHSVFWLKTQNCKLDWGQVWRGRLNLEPNYRVQFHGVRFWFRTSSDHWTGHFYFKKSQEYWTR